MLWIDAFQILCRDRSLTVSWKINHKKGAHSPACSTHMYGKLKLLKISSRIALEWSQASNLLGKMSQAEGHCIKNTSQAEI